MSVIHDDAFDLLCGKLLGEGSHRRVYECRIRPDLVVKVEYEEDFRFFANVIENKFYYDAPEDVRKWLCPIEFMSPDGRVILQKKVQPILDLALLPEKLPAFLSDIKVENLGWLDGNLVCVDYVYVNLSKPSLRPVKVNWS